MIIAGACLGVAADFLLRARLGINFPLFVAAVIAARWIAGRVAAQPMTRTGVILAAAALVAALGVAWRDSSVLRTLNVTVCIGFLAIAAVPGGAIARWGVTEYINRFAIGVLRHLPGRLLRAVRSCCGLACQASC